MNLVCLSCDIRVNFAGITDFVVAVCTSVDEAKQLAERLTGSNLLWEQDDDPPDDWHTAKDKFLTEEGITGAHILIDTWMIRRVELNQVLRIGWDNDSGLLVDAVQINSA